MGKFYEAPCIVESYNTAISQSRSLHIFRPPLATLRCCFGPSKLKTNYTDTLSGNKLNCTVSYAKKLYLRCMRFATAICITLCLSDLPSYSICSETAQSLPQAECWAEISNDRRLDFGKMPYTATKDYSVQRTC